MAARRMGVNRYVHDQRVALGLLGQHAKLTRILFAVRDDLRIQIG